MTDPTCTCGHAEDEHAGGITTSCDCFGCSCQEWDRKPPRNPDTVTITISREDAEHFSFDLIDSWCKPEMRLKDACQAALGEDG